MKAYSRKALKIIAVLLAAFIMCVCFYPIVVVVIALGSTAAPAEKHTRLYELDGIVIRRQDKSGRTVLEYMQKDKPVEKVEILFKDRAAWLQVDLYFQDSTVLVVGEKMKRILNKNNTNHIVFAEDIKEQMEGDYQQYLSGLEEEGRHYRLENVSWECEDTLYNNRSTNPTRVHVTVLGVTDKEGN